MSIFMEANYEYFTDGPFNQGYPCTFTVLDRTYNSVEQYMMAYKAVTFLDIEAFNKIIVETDYVKLKALGRTIKKFDKQKWDEESQRIVYAGNLAKFTQNLDLYIKLLQTHDKKLVYVSEDIIWGWNFSSDGKNLLGKILTELRDDLISKITK